MMRTFAIGLFVLLSSLLHAQKFGHVHSVNLLTQLPEIAVADSLLLIYQEGIMAQGDSMVNVFRLNYEAYVKDAQSGTLSKAQAQARELKLTEEQETIQGFEQLAQMQVMERRQELYEPILNQIDEIIMLIGKEEGYSMIFDSSQQAVVYITQSEDVSAKILARLGK